MLIIYRLFSLMASEILKSKISTLHSGSLIYFVDDCHTSIYNFFYWNFLADVIKIFSNACKILNGPKVTNKLIIYPNCIFNFRGWLQGAISARAETSWNSAWLTGVGNLKPGLYFPRSWREKAILRGENVKCQQRVRGKAFHGRAEPITYGENISPGTLSRVENLAM